MRRTLNAHSNRSARACHIHCVQSSRPRIYKSGDCNIRERIIFKFKRLYNVQRGEIQVFYALFILTALEIFMLIPAADKFSLCELTSFYFCLSVRCEAGAPQLRSKSAEARHFYGRFHLIYLHVNDLQMA